MENHTRRIRKARRQGLAQKKPQEMAEPTRAPLRGRGMEGRDVPAEPRANARRKTVVTTRKLKRTTRGAMRRLRSPRGRAGSPAARGG